MRTSTLLSSVLGYTKKLFRNAIFQILSLIVALGSIGITYAAWQTINSSEGAAGQPVTQTLIQGMINNINDLNARIQNMETNGSSGKFWSSDGAKDCVPESGKIKNYNLFTKQTTYTNSFGIIGDDGYIVYPTQETMKSGTTKSVTSSSSSNLFGDTSTSTNIILCVDGKALNILSSNYSTTDKQDAFNVGQAR